MGYVCAIRMNEKNNSKQDEEEDDEVLKRTRTCQQLKNQEATVNLFSVAQCVWIVVRILKFDIGRMLHIRALLYGIDCILEPEKAKKKKKKTGKNEVN